MKYIFYSLIILFCIIVTWCTNTSHYIISKDIIKDSEEYYGKIIRLSDFPKSKLLNESYMDKINTSIWPGDIGSSAETALVPLVFDKKTLILYTAKRLNKESEGKYKTGKPMDIVEYITDIQTFHDVTGLKEAHPDYAEAIMGPDNQAIWAFDPYVKFFEVRK